MLTALRDAKDAGARIIHVNPLPEAGLARFKHPQDYMKGRLKSTKLADMHLAVRIGGDAALIEGVMRTTDPSERSKLPDHHLRARETYLITSADSPAWCSSTAISRHFLNVERVQYYAANRMSILPFLSNSHLRQLAAAEAHERYFPGSCEEAPRRRPRRVLNFVDSEEDDDYYYD